MGKCEFPVILFQVGDGTTSVTLLAAEFLKQVKPYVEEGLHPQIIIRAFRTATQLVWEYWLTWPCAWAPSYFSQDNTFTGV